MELSTIKDAFERVAKRQKLSTSKAQEVVDQLGHEIGQTLESIQSIHDTNSSVDQKSILTELKTKITAIGQRQQVDGLQKEVNINLSKCTKIIEKSSEPDISKACRDVDFDPHIVNQIILSHFYHEGLFDISDSLINEAGEPEAISLKSQFIELHQILEAMETRNLEPALNWVSANCKKLEQVGSNLDLKLHCLQFVEILRNKSQLDALNYARSHLARFASSHMDEVQKLMGCLVWSRKLDKSPYSEILSPTHWEKLAEELNQQFCSLLGQSSKSALNVVVSAGVEGLPTLLKLVNVMAAKKDEWQAMEQLPVPLELGKQFHFHSIFVCPVSRDQGSEDNPPMMLPCGHALCKQSINKLSKNNTRNFKCPYCPLETSVSQCRQLYF